MNALKESAERGDIDAQFELGMVFVEPGSTFQDTEKAVYWLSKASEQGHPGATYWLAMEIVDKDTIRGKELFEKAARLGDEDAIEVLGTDNPVSRMIKNAVNDSKKTPTRSESEFDFCVNTDVSSTINIVSEILSGMGFKLSYGTYENWPTINATRGSKMASALLGPFAGKNNIAVSFGLMFCSDDDSETFVGFGDMGSGIGKALTLTGGATTKILREVYKNVTENLLKKGLLIPE